MDHREPFAIGERMPAGALEPLLKLSSWQGPAFTGIAAGFSTRAAGNVALHVGDEPGDVIERRKAAADQLGWSFARWTSAEQVHGKRVHVVERSDVGNGSMSRESAITDADALVTNLPDVLLVQFFADCVPLYFYDPFTNAIGLAHAGWKGTAADIASATVEAMRESYGSQPQHLYAAIGPSIGACCYEVDEAVLDKLGPLAAVCGAESSIVPLSGGRAKLDLKLLNWHLMIKAGILPSRIEMSQWCTGCATDLFYSHRAENGNTGRMMSWLGRKTEDGK